MNHLLQNVFFPQKTVEYSAFVNFFYTIRQSTTPTPITRVAHCDAPRCISSSFLRSSSASLVAAHSRQPTRGPQGPKTY